MILANTLPGQDTIEFQPGLAGTLSLHATLPELEESITINGPGADLLTIDGMGLHGGFLGPQDSDLTLDLELRGMTLLRMEAPTTAVACAVYVRSGSVLLEDITVDFQGDSCAMRSGAEFGFFEDEALTVVIEGSRFLNHVGYEPVLFASSGQAVTIHSSEFAFNDGGIAKAMVISADQIELDDVWVHDNHGEEQSIAELFAREIRVHNSRFLDNSVIGGSLAFAGSMHAVAQAILVENSAFVRNAVDTSTKDFASGVYVRAFDIVIRNCTVSQNLGGTTALGIGMTFGDPNVARVEYTTITDNQFDLDPIYEAAGQVAFAYPGYAATLLLAGVIADGNSDGITTRDFTLAPGSTIDTLMDYSAISVTSVPFIEITPGSNLIGVDPLLAPLDMNGSPTPTQVPLGHSPLLDRIPSGSPTCNAFPEDQRGFTRPVGGGCDIGAAERRAALFLDSLEPPMSRLAGS